MSRKMTILGQWISGSKQNNKIIIEWVRWIVCLLLPFRCFCFAIFFFAKVARTPKHSESAFIGTLFKPLVLIYNVLTQYKVIIIRGKREQCWLHFHVVIENNCCYYIPAGSQKKKNAIKLSLNQRKIGIQCDLSESIVIKTMPVVC